MYKKKKRKGTWWLTQQLSSNTYGSISNFIYFPLQPRGKEAAGI